jgi:hypothetical protein
VYFLLIASVGLPGCMVLPVPGGEQAATFFELRRQDLCQSLVVESTWTYA